MVCLFMEQDQGHSGSYDEDDGELHEQSGETGRGANGPTVGIAATSRFVALSDVAEVMGAF